MGGANPVPCAFIFLSVTLRHYTHRKILVVFGPLAPIVMERGTTFWD
jgi:hypothetical protein